MAALEEFFRYLMNGCITGCDDVNRDERIHTINCKYELHKFREHNYPIRSNARKDSIHLQQPLFQVPRNYLRLGYVTTPTQVLPKAGSRQIQGQTHHTNGWYRGPH
ncbi:hypothetical protein QQ045_012981 [Rhodiola kirilowii]